MSLKVKTRNILFFALVVVLLGTAYFKFSIDQLKNTRSEIVYTQPTFKKAKIDKLPGELGPENNIIINAMPKSGSEYIKRTLMQGLAFESNPISSQYIPRDLVVFGQIKDFYKKSRQLSKQHLNPDPLSLQLLKRYSNKLVLQIRDPRQALLSWVHHVNELKAEGKDLYYFAPAPTPKYYNSSLSEQIDWNINNFLPELVLWLQEWDEAIVQEEANPHGLRILQITYEELVADEMALYNKILAYYNIPLEKFNYTPLKKDRNVHYRSGSTEEWRTALTDAQKAKVASIVPYSLLVKHGWNTPEDDQLYLAKHDNIILISAPKAGSTYLLKTLKENLGYQDVKISNGTFPQDQIINAKIATFYASPHQITKQHLSASKINLQTIKHFNGKIILHMRDPRSVVLSWVYHLKDLHSKKQEDLLYRNTPLPTESYYKLSQEQQIDWCIENFLPGLVGWMQDWVAVVDQEKSSQHPLPILVTTYDELVADEKGIYTKILSFYNIAHANINYVEQPKDERTNYRKGDPNEWRAVFTPKQKARIAQIVPASLLQRFNWQP